LQEFPVRVQEFGVRLQEFAVGVKEIGVRVQEIGNFLQEIAVLRHDFGLGMSEIMLIYNDLCKIGQEQPVFSPNACEINHNLLFDSDFLRV
jgi:hypothetical protein